MSYTNGLDKPSDYFTTKLYSGNGGTQSITGLDFQPDWVWCKVRSQTDNHAIFDAVRGGQKQLRSNTDGAELTRTNAISSFNSDGWSMGSQPEMNTNGQTYASWNWKAGTSFSNSAGANGATIASTGSVNQDAGFSIVSYTGNATNGAKVGHGLSSAPQMVITKSRASSGSWQVLTNIYPNYSEGDYIYLNDNGNKVNSANVSFLPTSTTWQMKSGQAGNTSGTKIAYCFHSVQGYSKFSSYKGNGNADGTFNYLGFKPAFVMCKRTDGTGNWGMNDTKRDPFNGTSHTCDANNAGDADDVGIRMDILSNGFKLKTNSSNWNTSGSTYIYMAFASNPFVTSTGVPATAR